VIGNEKENVLIFNSYSLYFVASFSLLIKT
jgi:hypothetical protein